MAERARTFGSVAADYERFRPGYPDDLVDTVLAFTDQPLATAVEIGAGTGKATRAFAHRGLLVTATDPDPQMLAVLRRQVPSAAVIQSTLEALPPTLPVDLVFSAAALHWTAPAGRWERIAGLLRPGGTFANFGGQRQLLDEDVAAAVDRARKPFLDDDSVPPPDAAPAGEAMQWPGTELASSPLFDRVSQTVIEQRATVAADEFVGLISTVSAYLVLPQQDRLAVLRQIRKVLPEQVQISRDITVHLARRL